MAYKEDDIRAKWDLNTENKPESSEDMMKNLLGNAFDILFNSVDVPQGDKPKILDPHISKEGKKKLCSEALHPELWHPLVDVAELSLEKGYEPFNWLEKGKASTHLLYWFNAAQRHFDKAKMGFDINDEEKTLSGEPTKTKPAHLAQAAYCLLTALYLQSQEVCVDERRFKKGKLKR